MINLSVLIPVIVGTIVIGGSIIGFFQMQTRQNMEIESMKCQIKEIKDKQSKQSEYQIATEKNIIEINGKLDHILEAIAELKKMRGSKG